MAADKPGLVQAIKKAMDDSYEASKVSDADANAIRTQYANTLADAIEKYVQSITITIGANVVQTAGSAAAQANPLAITITNQPPNSIS